ncbi:MAG: hypothetical protein WCJ29_05020 [bacterium]
MKPEFRDAKVFAFGLDALAHLGGEDGRIELQQAFVRRGLEPMTVSLAHSAATSRGFSCKRFMQEIERLRVKLDPEQYKTLAEDFRAWFNKNNKRHSCAEYVIPACLDAGMRIAILAVGDRGFEIGKIAPLNIPERRLHSYFEIATGVKYKRVGALARDLGRVVYVDTAGVELDAVRGHEIPESAVMTVRVNHNREWKPEKTAFKHLEINSFEALLIPV